MLDLKVQMSGILLRPSVTAALSGMNTTVTCCCPAPCSNKTAAHAELSKQHHSLQEASGALASDNEQLRAALAAAQQRAQQAETLGAGLQAECAASRQLQAALQEEASRLKTELQQVSTGHAEMCGSGWIALVCLQGMHTVCS